MRWAGADGEEKIARVDGARLSCCDLGWACRGHWALGCAIRVPVGGRWTAGVAGALEQQQVGATRHELDSKRLPRAEAPGLRSSPSRIVVLCVCGQGARAPARRVENYDWRTSASGSIAVLLWVLLFLSVDKHAFTSRLVDRLGLGRRISGQARARAGAGRGRRARLDARVLNLLYLHLS